MVETPTDLQKALAKKVVRTNVKRARDPGGQLGAAVTLLGALAGPSKVYSKIPAPRQVSRYVGKTGYPK